MSHIVAHTIIVKSINHLVIDTLIFFSKSNWYSSIVLYKNKHKHYTNTYPGLKWLARSLSFSTLNFSKDTGVRVAFCSTVEEAIFVPHFEQNLWFSSTLVPHDEQNILNHKHVFNTTSRSSRCHEILQLRQDFMYVPILRCFSRAFRTLFCDLVNFEL